MQKKINIVEVFAADSPALRNIGTGIVLFGMVLLCFIWIGLYYKIGSERQMELDNAAKETSNFARTFEEHTLRTIKSVDQTALFLKYLYEKEGQAIDIPQNIHEGRLANQPVVLMGVIDENGDLIASSQVPFVSSNIKDREHFQVHKEIDTGQLFISKPVLGRSSGKWSIQMSRRINKTDGSFGGVVVVAVDPFYFAEFYKQVDLGKNSSITLIGRDGIVRARRSEGNTGAGQSLNNSMLMVKLSISDTGYYTAKSPIDGISRIYSFRALADYPLIVLVGVDEKVVWKNLNQRIALYYLVAGMATVVILSFIIVLLGVTAQQKCAERTLKQARNDLESKVQLRTQELFVANQELITMNEELQGTNQELEEEIAERMKVEETLQQKTEDIRHMAYSDALTGLPNRAHLNERLDAEIGKARRGEALGCILFFDIDNLKTINDIFGHTRGDALIIKAGLCIVAEAGNDAFVARIGGDEFIVILPGQSEQEQIALIADRMISALSREYESCGDRFHMSASAGIAVYPTDGNSAEEILRNADNAMYAAKGDGKNCWRFYKTAMHKEAYEKMLLTNSLRHAIERGELVLHYQPQVVVKGGRVAGFEALLRWNSPEYGFISPACFIPLAEQSGIIQPIGQWVLRQACQFARQLAGKGWGDIHVAVNISANQLVADNFIAIVRSAVDEAGIEPCQLELEITESVLMASLEDATHKLRKLRDLGVRLALDDFGTGYSSLTYLRYLPVETLKIDKSFIDMITTDPIVSKIIGAIINMAHILNMTVVAEGVEIKQQLQYLTDNCCDRVQGYIFSRPLPEIEAIQFLDTHTL